ncbi:hypothetical protein DSUL_50121 [Desulfovibrionales bacterium]
MAITLICWAIFSAGDFIDNIFYGLLALGYSFAIFLDILGRFDSVSLSLFSVVPILSYALANFTYLLSSSLWTRFDHTLYRFSASL